MSPSSFLLFQLFIDRFLTLMQYEIHVHGRNWLLQAEIVTQLSMNKFMATKASGSDKASNVQNVWRGKYNIRTLSQTHTLSSNIPIRQCDILEFMRVSSKCCKAE
jgi:hypothetical protein